MFSGRDVGSVCACSPRIPRPESEGIHSCSRLHIITLIILEPDHGFIPVPSECEIGRGLLDSSLVLSLNGAGIGAEEILSDRQDIPTRH